MKAFIEFTLPEEETAHRLAIDAHKYAIALEEVDNYCRGVLKYATEELSEDMVKHLEEIRRICSNYDY